MREQLYQFQCSCPYTLLSTFTWIVEFAIVRLYNRNILISLKKSLHFDLMRDLEISILFILIIFFISIDSTVFFIKILNDSKIYLLTNITFITMIFRFYWNFFFLFTSIFHFKRLIKFISYLSRYLLLEWYPDLYSGSIELAISIPFLSIEIFSFSLYPPLYRNFKRF